MLNRDAVLTVPRGTLKLMDVKVKFATPCNISAQSNHWDAERYTAWRTFIAVCDPSSCWFLDKNFVSGSFLDMFSPISQWLDASFEPNIDTVPSLESPFLSQQFTISESSNRELHRTVCHISQDNVHPIVLIENPKRENMLHFISCFCNEAQMSFH